MGLGKKMHKTAVVSGVCDGFIGNRMVAQYVAQAGYLLEEGATPQQVDRAMEKFGMAMGPFRMGDLAGNDIGWAIRKRRYAEDPAYAARAPKIYDRLCELGRFGQKTGAGWYRYEAGKRDAIPDPVIEELIVNYSKEAGITRRKISDDEIVERCIYALVNEGARILEEGIAQRASDIDMVYLTGYGFPLYRGGPDALRRHVGLNAVRARDSRVFARRREKRSGNRRRCSRGSPPKGKRRSTESDHGEKHDRSGHRIHRAHRPREELARRVQHDAWRDAGRARGQGRDRARRHRSARGRGRDPGLRQARGRHRRQHRPPDARCARAAR